MYKVPVHPGNCDNKHHTLKTYYNFSYRYVQISKSLLAQKIGNERGNSEIRRRGTHTQMLS